MSLAIFQHLDTLIFSMVAVLVAITVHEFAHAWTATALGDPTARAAGRVTLNPLAHIDLIGTIALPLALYFVGAPIFGWAKPVPYNPNFVRRGRWGEVLVAIAGPISNLLLAFILALPGRIYWINYQTLPTDQIYIFLATMVTLNVWLSAFNLIPIPPLDGSKILYLILDNLGVSHERIMWLEQMGPTLLILLIFSDSLLGINILYRLLDPIVTLMHWFVGSSTIPFG